MVVWVAFLTVTSGPNAQTINLSLPDQSAPAGETVDVPISADDFTEIVSMQFSIQWDTSVIRYQSFLSADLDNVAIGDLQSANGNLRFSWFDLDGVGKTLPDGSTIVLLKFLVTGDIGETTPVTITDTPLPVQIYRAGASPGLYDPVNLQQDTGSVTVSGQISVGIETGDVSCFGAANGFVNLTIQTPLVYTLSWTGPGFSSSDPDISGLAAGTYHVEIVDENGDLLFEQDLTIRQPAELAVVAETVQAGCDTGLGIVTVNVSGGTGPFQYNLGAGPVSDNVFSNLQPGDFTVSVTDANQCQETLAFSIEGPVLPSVELGETRAICRGIPVILSAGEFAAYSWSTGANTPEISVSQPGNYSVTVINAEGCQASDQIMVTEGEQINLTIESDWFQICPGDTLQLLVSGAIRYSWDDPGGTLTATDIPDPRAFPRENTTYQVIGSGDCSSDTIQFQLFVFPQTAGVGADTCVAYRTPAQLIAFGGVSYEWEPAPFPLSDPFLPNPTVEPEDSATYVVEITDQNGCVTVDSMVVLVANDPLSSITAVNMITPNGDGKNDFLEFRGAEKFGPNTLKIYNRWGNLVYQKVNYQNDDDRFDGMYKGQPLPAGNYYYVIAFRTGEIKQKLTIVRD